MRNPLHQIQTPVLQQIISLSQHVSMSSPLAQSVTAIVWYIGTGTDTVAISRTAGTMVFTDSLASTLPNDGTSAAGTLTFSLATVDTMGEVMDVINLSDNFRMRLVASLRSTTPLSLDALSATNTTSGGLGLLGISGNTGSLNVAFNGNGVGSVTTTPTTIVFADSSTGSPTLPNDGTSTAGTLTFSVAAANTLTKIVALINASTNFTATLTNVNGTTAPTVLRVIALTVVTATATSFSTDISGADSLIICIGPEADTSLYQSAQFPNFAYPATSKTNFLGQYKDPAKRDTLLRGVGRLHVYEAVSRLGAFDFTASNAAGTETPTLTLYDSSQTLDTQVATFKGTNATKLSESWDTPDLAGQQVGGGEYQSTLGNRLVAVLSSPVSAFNLAKLNVRGVYGEGGVQIGEQT